MRSCYVLALAALVGLGACGDNGGGDGGTVVDMAMSNTGGDGGGFMPDMVKLDFMPPAQSIHVFWDLWNKLKQGEPDNMQSQKCGEAGATEIKFYVRNPASGAEATTTLPCPTNSQNGDGYAKLPDSTGPFSVCATLPGKAMSVSYKVVDVKVNSEPNVTIFSEGCTETKCVCP